MAHSYLHVFFQDAFSRKVFNNNILDFLRGFLELQLVSNMPDKALHGETVPLF